MSPSYLALWQPYVAPQIAEWATKHISTGRNEPANVSLKARRNTLKTSLRRSASVMLDAKCCVLYCSTPLRTPCVVIRFVYFVSPCPYNLGLSISDLQYLQRPLFLPFSNQKSKIIHLKITFTWFLGYFLWVQLDCKNWTQHLTLTFVSFAFCVSYIPVSSFFPAVPSPPLLLLNAQCSALARPPPEMRQMALRRPVSVSSISMGSSWLAKVNTKSVSGPKPALCICVRLRVSPSEKVMVSWSGVYLVQMRRIWQGGKEGRDRLSQQGFNGQETLNEHYISLGWTFSMTKTDKDLVFTSNLKALKFTFGQ